jgi:hypothetical protein
MSHHRHHYMKRDEVQHWKLHRLFRNPKVRQVLIGCVICHPKRKLNNKKDGRIHSLELLTE